MVAIQTLTLVFLVAAISVAEDCQKGQQVRLTRVLAMKCNANKKWVAKVKEEKEKNNRAQPGAPPCEDSVSADQCQADRGHCNQYTEAGQKMDVTCPGTCESCDGCRCQDSSQWHKYCPYWSQYCDNSGVLGTWMTTNCRKTCNKCKCNCCSYKGKSHKLGDRIVLPDQCGELVCEEGLVAEPSALLPGAVQHNVSHPEEVTLVFRSLHAGADCCVLGNGTMVAEGWGGEVKHNGSSLQGICCHGVLSTPIKDIIFDDKTTTTTTPTTTTTLTTSTTTKDADILRGNAQCTRAYTTLNETWRRIVPGVAQPAGGYHCDRSPARGSHTGFKEGWYRFSFPEAPFAKIPTTPPLEENRQNDMKSCGTHRVAWVDASYPSVGEQPKDVTIKWAWGSNEASTESSAKIVACSTTEGQTVYLYYLPEQTACHHAYCAM